MDKNPEVGAVIVTKESSKGSNTGHVAIVNTITDTEVEVVEQNYVALGVVSTRWISKTSPIYKTALFIHPKV